MSSLTFQKEDYVDLVEEIDSVAVTVSREVDIYPDAAEPNIDHDKLIALEDAVLAITARDEQGDLKGFTVSIITRDILFKHILTSYSIFYYLDPEYRGGGAGRTLFQTTEKWYDKLGAQRSFIPRKLHIDSRELFNELEYVPVEVNYTKYRRH